MKPLTVGVTTRDRPAALARSLLSLGCAADCIAEALVFDDGSVPPAEATLDRRGLSVPMRVIRDNRAPGYIAGRNRLVEMATTPYVLLMDDDAALVARDAIQAALAVLQSDRTVAAVAFAQANIDGSPWPEKTQPAPASLPAIVRSFIGFAHLLRRDAFREVGGYQELFGFYGEEKELCLRLADRGYRVVYLPEARVVHDPDPSGRDARRYLRSVTRNDCLGSLLTDPWPRPLWIVPVRLVLYFRMRHTLKISDPGGFGWIVKSLLRSLSEVRARRRAVAWSSLRSWQRLGTNGVPYAVHDGARL